MKYLDIYIHNSRGKRVFINQSPFDRDEFTLKDAVNSLAKQCRFNGHTPVHYSVARHSVIVSRLCQEIMRDSLEDTESNENVIKESMAIGMAGLLHDIGESIVGDIISPIKNTFVSPELKEIETQWVTRFTNESNVWGFLFEELVKEADRKVTALEMKLLLNVPVSSILREMGSIAPKKYKVLMPIKEEYNWRDDVKLFFQEYRLLGGKEE